MRRDNQLLLVYHKIYEADNHRLILNYSIFGFAMIIQPNWFMLIFGPFVFEWESKDAEET